MKGLVEGIELDELSQPGTCESCEYAKNDLEGNSESQSGGVGEEHRQQSSYGPMEAVTYQIDWRKGILCYLHQRNLRWTVIDI
jgi:hypothetical protein